MVYVFSAGRYDIDRTRVYMPFDEAQSFFNREGVADEIEVMVERNPKTLGPILIPILEASVSAARSGHGRMLRAGSCARWRSRTT